MCGAVPTDRQAGIFCCVHLRRRSSSLPFWQDALRRYPSCHPFAAEHVRRLRDPSHHLFLLLPTLSHFFCSFLFLANFISSRARPGEMQSIKENDIAVRFVVASNEHISARLFVPLFWLHVTSLCFSWRRWLDVVQFVLASRTAARLPLSRSMSSRLQTRCAQCTKSSASLEVLLVLSFATRCDASLDASCLAPSPTPGRLAICPYSPRIISPWSDCLTSIRPPLFI